MVREELLWFPAPSATSTVRTLAPADSVGDHGELHDDSDPLPILHWTLVTSASSPDQLTVADGVAVHEPSAGEPPSAGAATWWSTNSDVVAELTRLA